MLVLSFSIKTNTFNFVFLKFSKITLCIYHIETLITKCFTKTHFRTHSYIWLTPERTT